MTSSPGTQAVVLVPPGTWEVDPARSTVSFAVRHLKVTKVRGHFREITGVVHCDPAGEASIDGTVEVASIDTDDRRRDVRRCAEGFFDAEQHPTIAITAVSRPVGPGEAPAIRGTLRMRAASRPLELLLDAPGSPVAGKGEIRIRASGVVSRRGFGLERDAAFAAGGLVVDDRVRLGLDVVVVRQPHPSAGEP